MVQPMRRELPLRRPTPPYVVQMTRLRVGACVSGAARHQAGFRLDEKLYRCCHCAPMGRSCETYSLRGGGPDSPPGGGCLPYLYALRSAPPIFARMLNAISHRIIKVASLMACPEEEAPVERPTPFRQAPGTEVIATPIPNYSAPISSLQAPRLCNTLPLQSIDLPMLAFEAPSLLGYALSEPYYGLVR